MTTVTSTPRSASDSSALSIEVESISSFSTTTLWAAEPMTAASSGSDPGLQTRSIPGGPGDGAAPDQSVAKTDSMAATSAGWLSITTKSLVVA